MKANYKQMPLALELMPDGYHKFRFDIAEVVSGENTSYNCNEVIIAGAVTSEKVISACMEDKWGNGVEQKLINDYNEYKSGLSEDADAESRYVSFLTERKALKGYVHSCLGGM